MSSTHVALTIAGSDSGAGAGIQADLKTFQALGVYGVSAITAVTAQNTLGVRAIHALPASIIAEQIDAVLDDFPVGATKTGMLPNAEAIASVADRVRHWRLDRALVVDPVMVASSGDRLLPEDAVRTLVDELMPLAAVVTPNLPEAEALVGRALATDQDIRQAAREICALGARAVVITGGHRPGNAVDVVFDGRQLHALAAQRIDSPHTHGTGCTFSAALAANLALGTPLLEAVRRAKAYVTEAIRHAEPLGAGHGPLAHDWLLSRAPLTDPEPART